MARTTTITKNNLINDIHRVAGLTETGNVRVTDYITHGAFSLGTVKKFFGASTNEVFAQALEMEPTEDTLDDSTVRMLATKAIKDMGKAGVKTNTKSFNRYARGIDSKDVAELYGSFAGGVRELGYEVDEVAPVKARKPYTRKVKGGSTRVLIGA